MSEVVPLSTVVEVVEVEVVEVDDVVGTMDVLVVDCSAAAALHALTSTARATSLATMVRIGAMLRTARRLYGINPE